MLLQCPYFAGLLVKMVHSFSTKNLFAMILIFATIMFTSILFSPLFSFNTHDSHPLIQTRGEGIRATSHHDKSITPTVGKRNVAALDDNHIHELSLNQEATCILDERVCGAEFCPGHNKSDTTSAYIDAAPPPNCKTLWFTGISEPILEKADDIIQTLPFANLSTSPFVGSYMNFYMLALESLALQESKKQGLNPREKNVLQPVLLLNEFGNINSSKIDSSFIAQFAKSRGGIVIPVKELSFQDAVDEIFHFEKSIQNGHRVGPFLRMDIPQIISSHGLFDLPGVCNDAFVLYTDTDVFFPNPISHRDIQQLKYQMSSTTVISNGVSLTTASPAVVMYGRESSKYPQISNTGVMMIDVQKFALEMTAILDYGFQVSKEKGQDTEPFDSYDQGWLNAYFERKEGLGAPLRTILPITFNWKVYWRLNPSTWYDLKIIHFHGPKPGRLFENIAMCDFIGGKASGLWPSYGGLVRQGICCDHGVTATILLRAIQGITNYLLFLKL